MLEILRTANWTTSNIILCKCPDGNSLLFIKLYSYLNYIYDTVFKVILENFHYFLHCVYQYIRKRWRFPTYNGFFEWHFDSSLFIRWRHFRYDCFVGFCQAVMVTCLSRFRFNFNVVLFSFFSIFFYQFSLSFPLLLI